MQYFDFKDFILSLLFLFSTCQMSEPTPVSITDNSSSINLSEPKDEGEEDYSTVSTKLTLLLLAKKKIYAFEGMDIEKGDYYEFASIRKVINQSKKKFTKNEFVVVIKPTIKTDYDTTVDVLDEMIINKIEKYAIVDLTDAEKQFLNMGN